MNRKRIIIAGLGIFFSVRVLYALGRDSIGTTGAKFLQLGVSARAIAMGEAFSAVSDGADSIYWNPAALSQIKGQSFSFMHATYLQSIFYDFASYAKCVGKVGTFDLAVQYLNVGSIDQTDEFGIQTGQFKPYDVAVSLGWGYGLLHKRETGKEILSFGIVGKYIQSRIIDTAVSGAVDLGIRWNASRLVALSLVAQNVGPDIKFKEESDPLPLMIKVGYSYRVFLHPNWIVAVDGNFPRDNIPYAAMGTEYRKAISRDISISGRTGFNTLATTTGLNGLSSISAGGGINWRNYSVDFAWVPFARLGNTYRVGLEVQF